MSSLRATTSQTVGPFFCLGLDHLVRQDLTAPGVSGERVEIEGRVTDGEGKGVPDALVEIWQANAHGRYSHPEDTQEKTLEAAFLGYGRAATDEDGRFHFVTIKPGAVPGPNGRPQAPHVAVSVFARGLLRRLVTRMYFTDEAANAEDYVMSLVDAARRRTLVAQQGDRRGQLSWSVVLQGPEETVFFDI